MEDFTCARCPESLESTGMAGLDLDQCPHCGGIFFESPDLSRVLMEGAPKKHEVDDSSCPRCRIALERLDPSVPGGFTYEICTACHGVWLDASELNRLKRIRNNVAPEGGKESDAKRLRAAAVLEQMEGLLTLLDRQRLDRLSRLERMMASGLSDSRDLRSTRAVVEAEFAIARQALAGSPLFQEARTLCIGGFITGAQFESVRERLEA